MITPSMNFSVKVFLKKYFYIESLSLHHYIAATLILIAILVGTYAVTQQVIFGFDQARDAFEAQSIAHGDIKIQGPKTDIEGVFHGVLWYYFLSLPYSFFQGSTQLVAALVFVLTLFSAVICYHFVYRLFKKKELALLSTILYISSPLVLAFSRWLSNPTLAIFATPGLLLSLWLYIEKKSAKKALVVGALYGVIIQADLAFVAMLIFLPLYLVVYRVRPRLFDVLLFIAGLTVSCSSYLLVELKFKGRSLTELSHFLHGQASPQVLDKAENVAHKYSELFSLTFFSVPVIVFWVGLVIVAVLLILRRKSLAKNPIIFLCIWLSNLVLFSFFGSAIVASSYIFAPSVSVMICLVAYILFQVVPRQLLWGILISITFLQFSTTFSWLHQSVTPLSIQRGITATEQKRVVEYIYQQASGQPFVITTVTNPLGINTTWAYVFGQYGEKKYGYLPEWDGPDQTGYLGADRLVKVAALKTDQLYFLIVEPTEGIPDYFVRQAKATADSKTRVVATQSIGYYTVEKRITK